MTSSARVLILMRTTRRVGHLRFEQLANDREPGAGLASCPPMSPQSATRSRGAAHVSAPPALARRTSCPAAAVGTSGDFLGHSRWCLQDIARSLHRFVTHRGRSFRDARGCRMTGGSCAIGCTMAHGSGRNRRKVPEILAKISAIIPDCRKSFCAI